MLNFKKKEIPANQLQILNNHHHLIQKLTLLKIPYFKKHYKI
jgi:hypothetical protein